MKFVLLVEGYTEEESLPNFLRKWFNPRLSKSVGFAAIRFDGWSELVKDAPNRTRRLLNEPGQKDNIIAVIGLLDLYLYPRNSARTFYPQDKVTALERFGWAKQHLEKEVGQTRFRQFFAVHEIEAWLLSDPSLFDDKVRKSLSGIAQQHPEQINSDEPPKKLLEKLYRDKLKTNYKERVDGRNLFEKLNPEIAYQKCPALKMMLDEMLKLAKEAGL